jgi:RecB family exonuclease
MTHRLDSLLRSLQQADRLAAIDVVCPSPAAATELRTACVRTGPLLDVRFVTLGAAARRLAWGPTEASGRASWPAGADELLAGSLLAANPGSHFAPIAALPGTAAALAAALGELEWHGIEPPAVRAAAREAAPDRSADGRRLGEVAGHLEEFLAARRPFATGPAAYLAALAALERDRDAAKRLVFVEPLAATGLALRLVAALRDAGARTVELDEPATAGRELVVSSAPGPAAECREALREILRAADELQLPLGRLAVAPVVAEPYAELLREEAGRLGLPLDPVHGVRLDRTAEGAALRQALALPLAGFPRAATLDLLRASCVRAAQAAGLEGGDPVAWDRTSRDAGVVEGPEDFRRKLERFAERGRGPAAVQLGRVVERLITDLAPDAGFASWSAARERLRRFVERWLAPSDARDAATELLRGLQAFDAATGGARRPDPAALRRTVLALLARRTVPDPRRTPGGVLLADPAALAGRRPVVLVIPGLAADAWPRSPAPDPILLDADRRRLAVRPGPGAVPLPLAADRARREREDLARALRGAERRVVLLFPSRDPASGSPRLPSPALLDALRDGGTAAPRAGEVVRRAAGRRVESRLRVPISPAERAAAEGGRTRLRRTAALLDAEDPFLRTRLRAEAGRDDRANLGPWAGDCSASSVVRAAAATVAARELSASRLQTWAGCPLQFLLRYVLRLEPLVEPEEQYPFDGGEQGSAFHDVACRLFRELDEARALPLRDVPAALRRAEALAEECLAPIAANVQPRFRSRFDADRERFRGALRAWLDYEAAAGEAATGCFEQIFGAPGKRPADEAGTAVSLALDNGSHAAFGGYIDRADLLDGGEVDLIDYKTGVPRAAMRGLDSGRNLQLAVYAVAAGALWPDRRVRRLLFRHVPLGTGRPSDTAFDREQARPAALRPLVAAIVRGMASAVFPHAPGRGPRMAPCSFCDFTLYCGPWAARDALARIKSETPQRVAVLAFREGGDAEERSGT